MRYQFYREHKYVSSALNDLERKIAKADFSKTQEVQGLLQNFQELSEMLKGHAEYENERLHTLLKKKNAPLYEHVEQDHADQENQLFQIQELFDQISKSSSAEKRISLGYKLYLTYRKFVADNLIHLHEEETLLLPELQRLYSDEELRLVEAPTYQMLTPDEMIQMIEILFPHMNPSDKVAFLFDIRVLEPKKFEVLWERLSPTFPEEQKQHFAQKLCI